MMLKHTLELITYNIYVEWNKINRKKIKTYLIWLKNESVSSNPMSFFRSVDAIDKLSRNKVAQILYSVRGCIYVVVPAFPVGAEAVGVLHTQVQTLNEHHTNINKQ